MTELMKVKGIKWIEESELYLSMDEDADEIKFESKFIIPDILTNENLEKVYPATRFFDSYPLNFLDYLRERKEEEFDSLLNSDVISLTEIEIKIVLLRFR